MDLSDEEGEIAPHCVTNYHFINDKEEPISFTVLPLQWSENENLGDVERPVYLQGNADDGLQKIYKRVIAWRFELSYVQPEISVLSKEKKWLTLQKPRKSFENIIRTILITINLLHFVKKNPEACWKSIWTYLFTELSSFDIQHSEEDLLNHLPLIREAVERDKDLAKSKYLFTYMEKPTTNKAFKEEMQTVQKPEFINDDDCEGGGVGKNDDGTNELYDHVCAICDNGGEILCCEGRCMRSFHATEKDGSDTLCESLGFMEHQVKALASFMCQNCKHNQHQCFVCGKLGSSDKSRGAEVFSCACATCGHFYHPGCVANLLHPASVNQAEELQDKIAAGESFTCPAHKCFVCKRGENKEEHENQFAICRRCPKTYHRKCLPRSISFECSNDQSMQRAWDGLLPNRILMYCMDHEIIRELATPARDHLKFPNIERKKKVQGSAQQASRGKCVASIKWKASELFSTQGTVVKLQERIEKAGGGSINLGGSTKNMQKRCGPDFDLFRKKNAIHPVRIPPKNNIRSAPYSSLRRVESQLSLGNHNSSGNLKAYPHKSISMQQKIASAIGKKSKEETIVKMANSSQSSVDPKIKNRIIALMEEVASSIDYEEFIKSKKGPTGNVIYDNSLEKSITMGKVEGSVEAIRTALSKLDAGCSIEDAKAVCEPNILSQVFKWKRKLNVYLAPFLHGMRYTSFGRHFTKVDKLKEIVNRLHWYMQDGDTLVDFCCGSNDFSCLMKEKLEKAGRHCKFRNYDIFTPKNAFNFEKRDWMTVNQEELPDGSQLIMGLNPPFGVNGTLANKFINKALEFRPKLLILIVPDETKRLDEKAGYNLIWEDKEIVSGKSFYLPGSIDTHNKQLEDWNLKAPPLYLWSRCDWSVRHKAIAKEQGHIWNNQELHEKGNTIRNYLMEENHNCYSDYSSLYASDEIYRMLDDVPDDNNEAEAEAEGAGAIVHDKVIESSFSHDSGGIDWKNNLNGMEYEGGNQTEGLKQGNCDGWTPCDTDDFSVDMELSTPIDSPVRSAAQNEDIETSEMEVIEEIRQDIQTSHSERALPIELEHHRIQTGNPTSTDSKLNFSSANNLNLSWPQNFTYQSHGCTTGTIHNSNLTSYNDRMEEIRRWETYGIANSNNALHGLPLNHIAPNMGYGFQHLGFSSSLPPGVDYPQTSMVSRSGNLASVPQSLNHSDPANPASQPKSPTR